MKNKNKIILSILALLFLGLATFYYINQKNQIDSSYGKDFKGVPIYEGAKTIQDDVIESEEGNTQGIRSYAVDNYKGDIDSAVKYFLDNLDEKLWTVEEVKDQNNKSNDKEGNRQFILTAKSKEITSKLIVNISVYSEKLLISINAVL